MILKIYLLKQVYLCLKYPLKKNDYKKLFKILETMIIHQNKYRYKYWKKS